LKTVKTATTQQVMIKGVKVCNIHSTSVGKKTKTGELSAYLMEKPRDDLLKLPKMLLLARKSEK